MKMRSDAIKVVYTHAFSPTFGGNMVCHSLVAHTFSSSVLTCISLVQYQAFISRPPFAFHLASALSPCTVSHFIRMQHRTRICLPLVHCVYHSRSSAALFILPGRIYIDSHRASIRTERELETSLRDLSTSPLLSRPSTTHTP